MPYTAYNSVSKMGLAASGGAVKEQYIPLWVYSSGTVSAPNGSQYVQKGSSTGNSSFSNACKLYMVNSNWKSQKFALEVSFYASSGKTATIQLYEGSTATAISGASVTTTSTTATVVRSSTFTLSSVSSFGIGITNAYLTKAHLVAIN